MTIPSGGSLTARLVALLESLTGAPSPNSLSDVHAAIAAILGPEGAQVSLNDLLVNLTRDGLADLKTIGDAVTGLQGVNGATLSSLVTEAQFDATMPLVLSRLLDIEERLDLLQSAIGAQPYESLELASVRGLLWALNRNLDALTVGRPPTGTGTDVSSGQESVAEGRRYAVFTPPVAGLAITNGGITVTPGAPGWAAFVQTTAPVAYLSGAEVPPAAWLELDSGVGYTFSVDAQYPIRVTMRRPLPQSYTFTTQLADANWYFVLDLSPLATEAGGSIIGIEDISGWTLEHVSGTGAVRVKFRDSNDYYARVSPGQAVIVGTINGPWALAQNRPTDGDGPATVRLTPPA